MNNVNRINHSVALNNDTLRMLAPSIFTTTADEHLSERYKPIPTFAMIEELREEGFDVVNASQFQKKDEVGDYAKHQVILRPRGGVNLTKVGDTYAEISLINSHNGRSPAIISGHVFRLACLNGMTVPENMGEVTKVYHKGSVIEEIVAGMRRAVEGSKETMDRIQHWGSINLTRGEQEFFAGYAHKLRFGNVEDAEEHYIKPAQLLEARRYVDSKSDLWTVTNVIQENSLQSVRGVSPRTGREIASQPITSIDTRKRINEGLLQMAKIFEEVKG